MVQLAGEEILAFLGALALGHVDDRREHATPALTLDRIERDLDRKLAAVLAAAAEILARAHGSRLRVFGETGAQTLVLSAQAVGHQELDALAQQLVAAVAEQRLGRGIDQ